MSEFSDVPKEKLNEIKEELNGIKERLLILESARQGKARFFFQYLLAPILVLGLGFYFNLHLQEKKSEVQQLELVHSMLPKLFSEETYLALATQKLLNSVLQDEDLKSGIQEIIKKNLQEKLRNLPSNQRKIESEKIIQDAERVKSPLFEELSKYENALRSERQGFQYLINADYEKAIKSFEEAEKIYPTFHQVYEIATLLKTNLNSLDDQNTRKRVIKIIVDDMSWKAPEELLTKLREEIKE